MLKDRAATERAAKHRPLYKPINRPPFTIPGLYLIALGPHYRLPKPLNTPYSLIARLDSNAAPGPTGRPLGGLPPDPF
jgi:hypothetical protein